METKISPELKAKGVSALRIAEVLLKPTPPSDGPPLPQSWDVSWPGFFTRGIQRIISQGPLGPWKTIKEKGLKEELRQEFEIITGRKIIE
jgi:hypothetical protein